MIKLLRHKITGNYFVKDYYKQTIKKFENKNDALKEYKRLKRNEHNREKNQILKELCGTSARQAKMDMGL